MLRGSTETIAISQKGPFPFGKVRQTFANAVLSSVTKGASA
jgi:hypothetical protein